MKLLNYLSIAALLVLIAGCGQNEATSGSGSETANNAANSTTAGQPSGGSKPNATAEAEFKETFEGALAAAKERNTLVMIDFWATWCGPCKALQQQTFPQAEVQERFKKLVLVKLDVDKEEGGKMSQQFNIQSIPVCLFLNGEGKEVGRIEGNVPKDEFVMQMDKIIANKG